MLRRCGSQRPESIDLLRPLRLDVDKCKEYPIRHKTHDNGKSSKDLFKSRLRSNIAIFDRARPRLTIPLASVSFGPCKSQLHSTCLCPRSLPPLANDSADLLLGDPDEDEALFCPYLLSFVLSR